GRDRVEPALATEGAVGVAGEEDRGAVRGPAGDGAVGGLEGQAPGRPAARRHDVDLGRSLLAPDEGEQRAVRREARVAGLPNPRGEPPGPTTLGRRHPEIVLADEDERIAVQGGES